MGWNDVIPGYMDRKAWINVIQLIKVPSHRVPDVSPIMFKDSMTISGMKENKIY